MQPLPSPSVILGFDTIVDPRLGKQFSILVDNVARTIHKLGSNDVGICNEVEVFLQPLLADTAWIPTELTQPAETEYRRECLYEAPDGAFSIGVFTWIPNHLSRIHDHHAWAVMGNLTGRLRSENFMAVSPGRAFKHIPDNVLQPGEAMWSTPNRGDIHRVSVASEEKSISIHIYGSRFDTVNRNYYTEIVNPEAQ